MRAVATFGSNWRIGQDEHYPACMYVRYGPYRFVRHPIYWGMTISALGQMLLTNADIRGLILLVNMTTYDLVQGRAESHRWSNRQSNVLPNKSRQQTPAATLVSRTLLSLSGPLLLKFGVMQRGIFNWWRK